MEPDVDHGDRQAPLAARGNALPSDDPAARRLLAPGKRPLGVASRHHVLHRSPPVLLRLPDPLRALGPDATLPELLPQRCCLIAFLGREAREACSRSSPLACVVRFAQAMPPPSVRLW